MSASQCPYVCERCSRRLGTATCADSGTVISIAIEAAGSIVDCTPVTMLHCRCGHRNAVHSGIAIVLEERPLDRVALGIGTEATA